MADKNNTVLHKKHVGIPDDPSFDAGIQVSDWHDEHTFSGGNDGDILVRDTSTSDGVSFQAMTTALTGRLIAVNTASQTYSGNSPSSFLGNMTINIPKDCAVLTIVEATIDDASSSLLNCSFTFQIDGANAGNWLILSGGEAATFVLVPTLSAGSHTFRGFFTAAVAPITNALLRITTLAYG